MKKFNKHNLTGVQYEVALRLSKSLSGLTNKEISMSMYGKPYQSSVGNAVNELKRIGLIKSKNVGCRPERYQWVGEIDL